jgi:hypothetical protein
VFEGGEGAAAVATVYQRRTSCVSDSDSFWMTHKPNCPCFDICQKKEKLLPDFYSKVAANEIVRISGNIGRIPYVPFLSFYGILRLRASDVLYGKFEGSSVGTRCP